MGNILDRSIEKPDEWRVETPEVRVIGQPGAASARWQKWAPNGTIRSGPTGSRTPPLDGFVESDPPSGAYFAARGSTSG